MTLEVAGTRTSLKWKDPRVKHCFMLIWKGLGVIEKNGTNLFSSHIQSVLFMYKMYVKDVSG